MSDTATDTSRDTLSRVPPRARIKLTLKAQSGPTHTGETQGIAPAMATTPFDTARTVEEPQTTGSDHPSPPPAPPSTSNPRLERAKANAEAVKKRKADDKLAAATLKKQKASVALAVPTAANSLKCVQPDRHVVHY